MSMSAGESVKNSLVQVQGTAIYQLMSCTLLQDPYFSHFVHGAEKQNNLQGTIPSSILGDHAH
ncbi:hypothetical protein E2C01_019759 [Portunus trituberculatus]|uniref:Uncharacterized protein n=1 Tax=Portunus trituberculatus TaxID=210409 RepID=A0A5B7E1C3_PORTR|nr:hypothetical protein [Portunus trituberculatus]